MPTDSALGGTEQRVATFFRASNVDHFRHILMPLKPLGEVGEALLEEGFEVESAGLTRISAVGAIPSLVSRIRKINPDILQTYLWGGNVLGRPAGRAAGVSSVVSGYASTDPWMRAHHVAADVATAHLATAHLANADAVADAVARRCRLPRTAIDVVYPGREIPAKPASPGKRKDRTVRGIAVGRLHRSKGYDVLLDAIAQTSPNVHIAIAGGGKGRRDLESRAARRGIENRVEFLGKRSDIEDLMRASDFYVLSSRWEGMPGALIEAMAAGLPAVATAVGGVPEALAEGETGFLVEPGDPGGLARSIDRVAASASLRKRLGAAARDRAIAHFSVTKMTHDWEAFYRRLVRLTHRPEHDL